MTTFNPAEARACQHLVDLALEEDLNAVGDLTSQAVISPSAAGRAAFVARAEGVLAGMPAAALVAAAVDPVLTIEPLLVDGSTVRPGNRLGTIAGPMRALLAAERTCLNFLQRLSGVATQTRRFVDAIGEHRSRILDTRKTTPGWRLLEKYAVRCGGGHNHRLGLYDGILIKDNHLAALSRHSAPITEAVRAARARYGSAVPVEIEIDDLGELEEALACTPDIILLDNMPPAHMAAAVRQRQELAPDIVLEASGGVTLANVADIAATGVDRISIGLLTHSAPALDIALDYEAP
jgi:nicotinate-nucleotide pyrophosphorylase (carboxylating)